MSFRSEIQDLTTPMQHFYYLKWIVKSRISRRNLSFNIFQSSLIRAQGVFLAVFPVIHDPGLSSSFLHLLLDVLSFSP